MKLSKEVLDTLQGAPFGEEDGVPNPPFLATDGRTECLRVLKRYFQDLEFVRTGGKDFNNKKLPDINFQIPARDILIDWPDNEEALNFPSIVMLPGKGDYETLGFGLVMDEDTVDKYGQGTVVVAVSEYVEIFTIEIWGAKLAEIRSIRSGLESAMSPTEGMYGIRFKVPNYFGQLVLFTIEDCTTTADEMSAKNQRRAQISVEMNFQVSYLANVHNLQVAIQTSFDANETAPYTIVDANGDEVISGETDIVDVTKLERTSGDADDLQREVRAKLKDETCS